MLLTEGEKNHIRKFAKAGDMVGLYEYLENLIDERIDDAIWHATIGEE
jgi:hypothetical protein